MPEKEKKAKKEKKNKKDKKETDEETELDLELDNTASAPQKEKKSKKRKAAKELEREEGANGEVTDDNDAQNDKQAAASDAMTTLVWHTTEESNDNESGEKKAHEQDDDVQKHEKQLKNKLPTRQERQRRENQKKMQTFVAEMRAQGKTKKEIDKLKKKVNAKLKHIQPNQEFSSVVALGDVQLSCRDCSADFVFSVQEQHFYQEKQYPPPVRCKECTAAKKVRMAGFDKKDAAWGAGAGYQQGGGYDRFSGGGGGGGGGQWPERAAPTGGGTRSNWGNI